MLKTWKRIIAYLIDILMITILTQSLASTTILNPTRNNYQKYTKDYNEKYTEFANFTIQLQKYYEDSTLTKEEYNKLIKKYPTYEEKLNKYYKEEKISEKDYTKLLKEISKDYSKTSNKIYYKIEKNSIFEMIIYLILTTLYFVGFNMITNGQTLGKKLLHLKIVSTSNEKEKVPMTSYIIRTVLMYQVIYYVVRLIGILTLNQANYIKITSTAYYIQSILDFLILTFIIVRQDKRGIHEILSKTKVQMLDRQGKEIQDKK